MFLDKGSVLVVDDEEGIRESTARYLGSLGYNVIMAANGAEALDKVAQEHIALLLLDVMMPGMSGVEVLEKVTAGYPDVAVLMMTAVVETAIAVDAMKQGAYDYITKPFNFEDLQVRVKKALERRTLLLESKRFSENLGNRIGEQTETMQSYFSELVKSLAREHNLLFGLEAMRNTKKGGQPLGGLPAELRKPMTSVDEFKNALLHILRRNTL